MSLDYLARSRSAVPPMVTSTAVLRLPTSADVEGETVTAEEGDAGASWADSHGLTRATDCPNYTTAFRLGCAREIGDQARLPSTPSPLSG
ncbi:MAG: hypothetical protein ACR2F8_11585 [Caulobacteraceae bacterium]